MLGKIVKKSRIALVLTSFGIVSGVGAQTTLLTTKAADSSVYASNNAGSLLVAKETASKCSRCHIPVHHGKARVFESISTSSSIADALCKAQASQKAKR